MGVWSARRPRDVSPELRQGMSRRVVRYRSRRPDDATIRVRLRELAAERCRFGFRRLDAKA